MDNTCIKAIITLTVGFLGLTAMFLGYKMRMDKKSIELEKNDRKQEQRHNHNCQRIEKLEEKNGKELKEIEELKKEIAELKATKNK